YFHACFTYQVISEPVFHTAPIAVETAHSAFTVQLSPAKPVQDISHATRPMAHIIEDWVSDSEDESELNDPQSALSFVQTSKHVKPSGHSAQPVEAPILDAIPNPTSSKTNVLTKSKLVYVTAVRPVSAIVLNVMVSRPRPAHSLNIRYNSTIRRHKTCSQSSKTSHSSPKVTAAKALVVSVVKGKKGKWVRRPKCSILDHDSRTTELNGGYVAFGGNPKGGKILDFKLPDESQVLLRVPRENNMYNVNLNDIVPFEDLTCLFAKETIDESNLWHRRLWHVNFKTINKLVKGNLVRGLPTKVFENQNTCVACKKEKQHRASCKTKPDSFVNQPLFRLHMDLFGPTFIKSVNKKCYCLVITDDYSRFTWVFFLATKDETSPILKTFITALEN
nr:putative ribonuclease H-like domain-containing protein [Tanacetum cinerariifolium]